MKTWQALTNHSTIRQIRTLVNVKIIAAVGTLYGRERGFLGAPSPPRPRSARLAPPMKGGLHCGKVAARRVRGRVVVDRPARRLKERLSAPWWPAGSAARRVARGIPLPVNTAPLSGRGVAKRARQRLNISQICQVAARGPPAVPVMNAGLVTGSGQAGRIEPGRMANPML